MKRRGFLSGLTLSAAGIPILAKAGEEESVFGIPNSLKGPSSDSEVMELSMNRIRLSMAEANIPVEAWADIVRASSVWHEVLFDKYSRTKFQIDPHVYLQERGIPPTLLDAQDTEVRLLKAILNDDVFNTAVKGDYQGLIDQLRLHGITLTETSKTAKKVAKIFKLNHQRLEKNLREMGVVNDSEIKRYINMNSIQHMMELINQGKVVFPGAITIPAFAFAITFAVTIISIATWIGMFATIGALAGGWAINSIRVIASGGNSDNMDARRKLAMVAPELYDDMDVKVRLAKIVGNKSLAEKAYLDLIRIETTALLEALEISGVCVIADEVKQEFQKDLEKLVNEAVGL